MRRRHALSIALAAVLGALAIVALPALAGARDDHHHRGHDRNGERHHHHGSRDRHENAGRISGFDSASGELTIARFGGGTISGLVTSSTEIKCEGRDDSAASSRDHGGNSGPGSGERGEEEPGDDQGGQGEEEPGDDHGDQNDDNDDGACTTADLTVGTVVHGIDREFENGVTTFDEIELGHTS
jgi:hypothetical protein